MTDYYDVTTLSYADVVQYTGYYTELMKKVVFIKMLYIFLCNIFYFALQYYFDLIRKKKANKLLTSNFGGFFLDDLGIKV